MTDMCAVDLSRLIRVTAVVLRAECSGLLTDLS